jgi:transcriptional regulator with XRE-family HTH domain
MLILDRIKEIRKAKGFSQKKMAELLNLSQPGYQKIEQGLNVLSIERFIDICRILEIDSYNIFLPPVNADKVEEIRKVMLSGSLSFENINRNSKYIRPKIDDLIETVGAGKIDNEALTEELKFIKNYIDIIIHESSNEAFKFNNIRDLEEKID